MKAFKERPDKTQKRERNQFLPLQLAQYTKPSVLLEKITNTFKNKSPQNATLNKEQDIQKNYFNHTMPQAGNQKSSIDEQSLALCKIEQNKSLNIFAESKNFIKRNAFTRASKQLLKN
ncbi:hypothetical protein ABPG72_014102 [Tetrahymena utriculariae]